MTNAARILDLSQLTRAQGFIIQGDSAYDYAGSSVSTAGDLNGDGIDDLIVGAPRGDNGGQNAGEAYMIFGKAGATRANIDLATLTAADGFIIQGDRADDRCGHSVSAAGGVDGDGIDDLIVGVPWGDNGGPQAGEAYVIFGQAGATRANIDLTTLTAADGFIIQGGAWESAGYSVSLAGDVNGDDIDDLIVGASLSINRTPNPKDYVIFGKDGATRANIDLTTLATSDGFSIQGGGYRHTVSLAGDVNGDGIDDLIVGAPRSDNGGRYAGEAYVIFGKAGATRTNIDLTTLAASDGFSIQGDSAWDYAGFSVSSAGDVNGDGIDDLIVGAPRGDNGGSYAGEAYVIFGGAGAMRTNIDLTTLANADGFIIQGDSAWDYAGFSVSSAGDVNGDGIDDLIAGARFGDDGGFRAGEAYVIFGKAGTTRADIDLTTLAATDGFIIQGDSGGDMAGSSVSSAGDVNGDGIDDLIVGAPEGDDGATNAGEAYVIYGSATIGLGGDITGTDEADRLSGTVVGERMSGLKGDDTLSGQQGEDALRGGFGRDILRGGDGHDTLQGGAHSDVLIGGFGQDTFTFLGARNDEVADFVLGTDTLALGQALTGDLTDVAAVIASIAAVVGPDVVFDFGDGRTIRLTGLSTTAGLADDVLIV